MAVCLMHRYRGLAVLGRSYGPVSPVRQGETGAAKR
jgi:hypothetical protein